MQTPLFVRPLTADERATLETGLRSSSAFTVRRCQIHLASAEGQSTPAIARELRCTDQTVRNAMHAFHRRGLGVLQPRSSRPHSTSTIFEAGACESLRALLHHSPRSFGKPTSRGTLALAAEVSFAQGLTPRMVSDEALRVALRRLGVAGKQAKHWITSPDPAYARKKLGWQSELEEGRLKRRKRGGRIAAKATTEGTPLAAGVECMPERLPVIDVFGHEFPCGTAVEPWNQNGSMASGPCRRQIGC